MAILMAVLSAGVYLCLRVAFHIQIHNGGYVDGGLISYDSYYHFAFARELQRTGSTFLFQNPFGTLDQQPLLFNLYSSVLALLPPLSIPALFIFDCAVGTLLVGMTSFSVLLLVPSLGAVEAFALLFGGGVAFIGAALGFFSETEAVAAAYWGLTFLLNQLSTPEIVYHFFLFFGLYGLVRRKNPIVLSVTGILTLLHPFTAMIFCAALLSAWLHRWTKSRRMVNDRMETLFCGLLSLGVCAGLFGFLLPAVSKDALYFRDVYQAARFQVDIKIYALFLSCPALFCLISFLFSPGVSLSPEDSERLWIFSGVTLFCILLTTSYLYTDRIIQPAHWSRAYPFVLFFAISSLMRQPAPSSKGGRALPALKLLLLSVALVDSAFGFAAVKGSLFADKRPPLFLTQEQARVIQTARDQPPGRFLYLRDSSNREVLGDVEYAMMALSPQKGFLGHAFFSPFLRSLSDAHYPGRKRLPGALVQKSDYILFDSALLNGLPAASWETIYEGKNLVFVKNQRIRSTSPSQESQPAHIPEGKGLQRKGTP